MTSTHSNDPTTSFRGLVASLPDFWQHAPELYFFRIEATFHSAKITRKTDKNYKLVEALPPTILSQVQTLLRDPPTDAPYTKLKAELLRLTSVSDRQRYHAIVKEEALDDRKPSELLRRIRSLVGNMKIDDKFFKEMFLERLPTSVQTILASGSDDLDISELAEMVDRMTFRQLKASLRAAADPENWTDHLPLVLLGIRSALKPDLDCSSAELVFGATVRLPGEMISSTPQGAVEDPANLLHRLQQFMRTLSPVPPSSSASPSYLEKDLTTCSHVYLRCDRVRRPLEPPHDGPFRVLSPGPKTFRIQRDNREEVVSVDRLKAAVPDTPLDEPCGPPPSASYHAASFSPSRIFPLSSCPLPPTATTDSNTSATRCIHSSTDPLYITRSGRHVHFPDRLVTHFF
nr:unnamed protein product [Spirometra erinaceieuropaei]